MIARDRRRASLGTCVFNYHTRQGYYSSTEPHISPTSTSKADSYLLVVIYIIVKVCVQACAVFIRLASCRSNLQDYMMARMICIIYNQLFHGQQCAISDVDGPRFDFAYESDVECALDKAPWNVDISVLVIDVHHGESDIFHT